MGRLEAERFVVIGGAGFVDMAFSPREGPVLEAKQPAAPATGEAHGDQERL